MEDDIRLLAVLWFWVRGGSDDDHHHHRRLVNWPFTSSPPEEGHRMLPLCLWYKHLIA